MLDNKELPSGWAEATINDLISEDGLFVDGDWIESKDQDPDGNVRLVQLADIGDGMFRDKSNRFLTQRRARELNCSFLKVGDVLVARMPDPIGRACIFPLKGRNKFITVVDVAVIRLGKNNISSGFLVHSINNQKIRNKINSLQSGTTRKRISRANLATIKFPIPPLPEQARIVVKIDELLSSLDKGIESIKIAHQQLQIYRKGVLKWAFEGKLTTKNVYEGELPKGWKWLKTGDIIKTINNGYTPKKEFLFEGSGDVPFIKVYNLNFDGTLNSAKNPTFIPNAIHKRDLKRSICYPGDVLINIVGPPLGKVSIVTNKYPEWNINQAIVLFRPNKNILSKYISYFLQNHVTIQWLTSTSKATAGQWNVKVSTCRVIPIPIPPTLNEQQLVISEIESRLSVCDKIEESITQSLMQAEALRQSILKMAFEGKLVPQDPNDEPASKLLERIRGNRQSSIKSKPKKKVVNKIKRSQKIKTKKAGK